MAIGDVYALAGSQFTVGSSLTAGITTIPGLVATTIKMISGSSAIVASASAGIDSGYPLTTTEAVAVAGPAKFYLASAGVTSVIAVLKGTSQGFEF
jgi:hypothetical protein